MSEKTGWGGAGRVWQAWRTWLAAALLLAAHAGLAVSSLAVKSVTNDELAHLPAGLAAVATGELRLNPEHPPLVKLLSGLAASTLHPSLPLASPAYRQGNEWAFGHRVFFESGNDPRTLLFRGRLPIVALSMLGGLGVFLWSRRRFGAGGGLLSLALYAFSPTILAHGRLVTMDAAVAAGTVWTLYLAWRARRPETGAHPLGHLAVRSGACGLALGLTLAAKFSGLILLPALALADLGASGVRARSVWRERLVRWGVMLPVAALVVTAFYLGAGGLARYVHDLGHLYGENDPNALTYLAGRFRQGRFPEYFLVALAVKTSLAGLVAMAGGLALAGRALLRRTPRWRDDLYLWIPAALWLAVHSGLALDLGVRYVLPLYPLLFVLAGGLVPALTPNRIPELAATPGNQPETAEGRPGTGSGAGRSWLRRLAPTLPALLASVLGLAQLSTALVAHPDYLPFFNRLAGGARGGVRWLDDSNLDWGQDLARLAPWLAARRIGRVRLLYYGAGVPRAYGVEREPMLPSDWLQAPRPGDYVVSAEYLIQGLHQAETAGVASDWLRRYRPSDVLGGTLYLYRFRASSLPAEDRQEEETGQAGEGGRSGGVERPAVDP